MTMSVTTVIEALGPALPNIVTAAGAITAGLGGVRLTQRYNERQRAREKASALNTKIEETTRELFEAVSELHLALSTHQPVHNTWQPRLMLLGSAFLELMAGKQSGGLALGMAQAGRLAVEANQRELLAAQELKAPMQRVMAAAARVALLPDGDVRNAAVRLAEAAAEAGQAYGRDNLWQRAKATTAREQADAALLAALGDLVEAASSHLHPQKEPARRVWPLRLIRRDRRGEQSDAAAIEAAVPAPRDGGHDITPGPAAAALPAGQPAAVPAPAPVRPAGRQWRQSGPRAS
jgi:hypothetical protein